MKKRYSIIFILSAFLLINWFTITNVYAETSNDNLDFMKTTQYKYCGADNESSALIVNIPTIIPRITSGAYNIVLVVVPVILIIMGVVDSYNKINTLTGNVSNTYNDIQNFELSTDGLNNIVSDMNAIKDSGTATIDSVKATREKIGACFEDPKGTLAGFIYLAASGGITAGKSFIGEALARTLTKGFISNDYLLSYGVKNGYEGLDFGGSSIFCGENKNMIDIEVRYDIEIGFLGLLIADPTVHVVQRVTIPAWLDGDGKRVEDCIGE